MSVCLAFHPRFLLRSLRGVVASLSLNWGYERQFASWFLTGDSKLLAVQFLRDSEIVEANCTCCPRRSLTGFCFVLVTPELGCLLSIKAKIVIVIAYYSSWTCFLVINFLGLHSHHLSVSIFVSQFHLTARLGYYVLYLLRFWVLVILLNWCWLCCIFSRSTRKSASQNPSQWVIYGWSLLAATDHKLHLFCEFAILLSDIGFILLLIASNSSPPSIQNSLKSKPGSADFIGTRSEISQPNYARIQDIWDIWCGGTDYKSGLLGSRSLVGGSKEVWTCSQICSVIPDYCY